MFSFLRSVSHLRVLCSFSKIYFLKSIIGVALLCRATPIMYKFKDYHEVLRDHCLPLLRLALQTNLGRVFVGGLMNLDQCLLQTQPHHPSRWP